MGICPCNERCTCRQNLQYRRPLFHRGGCVCRQQCHHQEWELNLGRRDTRRWGVRGPTRILHQRLAAKIPQAPSGARKIQQSRLASAYVCSHRRFDRSRCHSACRQNNRRIFDDCGGCTCDQRCPRLCARAWQSCTHCRLGMPVWWPPRLRSQQVELQNLRFDVHSFRPQRVALSGSPNSSPNSSSLTRCRWPVPVRLRTLVAGFRAGRIAVQSYLYRVSAGMSHISRHYSQRVTAVVFAFSVVAGFCRAGEVLLGKITGLVIRNRSMPDSLNWCCFLPKHYVRP
jgi:hypothetical protein